MVRVLASHQCVLGSIPEPFVICGLSSLLVLYSATRGFSLSTPVFPSLLNSNSIWIIVKHFVMSPWLGWLRKHSLCLTLNSHLHLFTFICRTFQGFVVIHTLFHQKREWFVLKVIHQSATHTHSGCVVISLSMDVVCYVLCKTLVPLWVPLSQTYLLYLCSLFQWTLVMSDFLALKFSSTQR